MTTSLILQIALSCTFVANIFCTSSPFDTGSLSQRTPGQRKPQKSSLVPAQERRNLTDSEKSDGQERLFAQWCALLDADLPHKAQVESSVRHILAEAHDFYPDEDSITDDLINITKNGHTLLFLLAQKGVVTQKDPFAHFLLEKGAEDPWKKPTTENDDSFLAGTGDCDRIRMRISFDESDQAQPNAERTPEREIRRNQKKPGFEAPKILAGIFLTLISAYFYTHAQSAPNSSLEVTK